jgi:proteasome lid subunit RPN8/RPN11/nitrogen fixation-related uncharacterized protein
VEGDIEFGDVQHAAPRNARRPDEDLHFAVAPYGEPAPGELPVFVDLDVMREIEDHASSDTSVELGGVLLGGQYEDSAGAPFVVITDCLRAQHYESTKGSFKFTHETWEAITRQRDEFPDELQLVGWYHTHPDWGVFLSGMDMFICDHFFNKPLDVAYVVDPCRGDRGMFQWTRDARQRTRRTSGFFVTASRFRQSELQQYIDQLSQRGPSMPSLTHNSGAPVVHITQPSPPAWQGIAVWATMVAQFCLIAIIAWRMQPASEVPTAFDNAAGGATPASRERDREAALQTDFLDKVLNELRGTEEGFAQRMQDEFARTKQLEDELHTEQRQNLALLREMDRANVELKDKQEALLAKVNRLERHLADSNERAETLETKLAAFTKAEKDRKKTTGAETTIVGNVPVTYLVGGGVGALALLFLGLAFFWRKRSNDLDDDQEDGRRSRVDASSQVGDRSDEGPDESSPVSSAAKNGS